MMAHLHADDDPALGGLRRPDRRGARHRQLRRAARRAGRRTCPSAAPSGSRTSSSPIPAPTCPVVRRRRSRPSPGQTVAIIGSTGAGKTTMLNLVPRLFDATDGQRARRRGRRTPDRARGALVAARPGPPEGVPLRRHRCQQPALRQARRDRGGDVGGPRDRPGPRLRPGDARRTRGPDRARRLEPQRRAATTPRDRAGGDPAGRRSTCSTTRSPRSTWPPMPGCARRWRR